MDYSTVNAIVCFLVITVMAIIFGHAVAHKSPKSLVWAAHPSTTLAYGLFGVAWFGTLVVWGIARAYGSPFPPSVQLVLSILDDIVKLVLLASALAYMRGREFNIVSTGTALGSLFVALTLWEIAWFGLHAYFPHNMFGAAIEAAPDVVLSCIAIVAVGWAFFVRWGGVAGWLYLFVTVFYAMLQLPAGIYLNFGDFIKAEYLPQLSLAFPFLAGGKILLAFGFVLLIWNAKITGLNVDTPRYWPGRVVPLPKNMYQWAGWPISIVVSFLVSALSNPLKQHLAAFVHRLFG